MNDQYFEKMPDDLVRFGSKLLPTGFRDLDRLIGGLRVSQLTILSGPSGSGKSTLLWNLVTQNALRNRQGVGIFSLEMIGKTIAQRLIAAEAAVSISQVENLSPDPETVQKIKSAIKSLDQSRIWVDESPYLDLATLIEKAKSLKENDNASFIVIDRLELIAGGRPLPLLANRLRILAREYELAILATTSTYRVSPASARRDLLLETADAMWFITGPEKQNQFDATKSLTKIIIVKNRYGPTGTVHLVFAPSLGKFYDMPDH